MSTVRGGKLSSLRHILRDRASKELGGSPREGMPESPPSSDPTKTNVLLDNAVEVIRSVTFEDNAYESHGGDELPGVFFEQEENDNEVSAADSSSSSYWALMEYGLGEKRTDWNDFLSEDALQQVLGASLITSPDPEEPEAVLNDETDPNVSWSDDESERSTTKRVFNVPKQEARNAEDESSRSISPTDDDSNPILAKFLPAGSPFTTFRRNSTSIALEETQHYLRKIQFLEQQLQEAQQHVAELQQRQEILVEKNPRASIFRTPSANSRSSTSIRRSRSFSELSKPHTPASLMHHSESLWERNKTLVTEIRFADQTCMELACQNTALTKERDDWQKKYEAMEERNSSLQELMETTQRSLSQAEATIESLRQVHSTSLGENTEIAELKLRIQNASQQALETTEVNQKLRREIVDMATQMEVGKERTECTVRRIVHFMNLQMERLHLVVANKCSQYDAKLVAFANAVKLMEDAILEYDDDDEASDTIQTTSSETGEMESDLVDEDAVTVKSGCVNATFSDIRKRNQSVDLARMEEARASLPMDCVHGDSESPMISPEKSNATANSGFILSSFTGLSEIELSILSEGTSETGGNSNNSKFMQHLQWMSSSPIPIQAFGMYGKHPSTQPESFGDSSESTNEPVVSNFHRGFKHISHHHSNLSYSMSEPSPILKNIPSTRSADPIDENAPQESTGNTETIEDGSVVRFAKQSQFLQNDKECMLQLLDESMCQLSKLHDLASSQEYGIAIREETLQMEKLAIESELHLLESKLKHRHDALDQERDDAIGDTVPDQEVTRIEAQLDKDELLQKLYEKVNEIEEKQEQIRYLQAEAKKRETLQSRYEALCIEKEEMDALLRQKFIFPKTLTGESETLINKLSEEISSFREELAASTLKIEMLTSAFDALQSEKTKELHELELSLERKVKECDALRRNVDSLREDLDALKIEKEKIQGTTVQLSEAINAQEEVVTSLRRRLSDSNEKIVELQAEIQDVNNRYSSSIDDLKDLRDDRNLIQDQFKALTETCKQLKEEKSCLISQLKEKDGMVDERHRLQLQMDMQVEELSHCFETIQSLENEILRSNDHRERSAEEMAKVRKSNEHLELKCTRLKEYIRKLTQKCDEWEKYHDRESNVLQHLKQGYEWNRLKASKLSVICQEKDQQVIDLLQSQRALEDEMEDIARELEPICENLGNASLYVH